jgi:hypothetical protein
MALGKTITYTPFQETSFGYGSGEIASAHSTEFPNATDIVKVIISFSYGTHWDYTTGHIATPTVGTAVSTFNKYNMEWLVKGERDDVDAVLAQLKFFPSDYEETRTWTPTALKDNQTTGLYANEEPPSIPDTQMGLRVYDSNDSLVQLYTIDWEADNYSYDNNRPYWSFEPTSQDVASLGIPPLIDLGTIANSTDENLIVKCEFRHWNSTSTYTGSAYGQFTQQHRFYVGDKKEAQRNYADARFNFTGSLTEAQAFLDNIGYNRPITGNIFDMFLTVTDGAVGSTVTKTCWFSDAPFTVSHQIPDYIATEEDFFTPLEFDDNFTITSSAEVNRYWFTLTLDATGQDAVTYMSEGTLSNGVFTSDYSYSIPSLRATMKTMGMELRDDFNDNFTFTIQWHGDNTTIGSSYSSAIQTVNVTVLDAVEITNLYTSHNFEEDHRYYFANGAGLPNIAGDSVLYNRQYTARITASDPNAVEVIWTYVPNKSYTFGVDFFWENGNQLRMVGTRDEVNEMLNGAYFEPATDYDQNFSFSYHQTRLSGDTTSDEAEGDFYNIEIGANNCISMTAVPHNEYSFTPSTQDWEEDISKIFDTGIRVTDLSDEQEYTASYGTTYTVYMKMIDMYGNNYNVGSLTSTSTGGAIGSTAGLNPKSYTGTKAQVNQAIANMKYVPSADITEQFWIQFKIVRNFDGAVLADYSDTRQIQFNEALPSYNYELTPQNVIWNEGEVVYFDSGIQITDKADSNPDMSTYLSGYEVRVRSKYWDGILSQPLDTFTLTSVDSGNSFVTGSGTFTDNLIISGSKENVNLALSNLRMAVNLDNLDWTQSPSGSFWVEYKIIRLADNKVFTNWGEITHFDEGVAEDQYNPIPNVTYVEDIRNQYIFSGVDLITDTIPEIYSNSNITYKSIIRLDSANFGSFNTSYANTEYVEDDYVDTDYTFVPSENLTVTATSDTITISGNKNDVNFAIKQIKFSPIADTNQSIQLFYTQERYINGVLDVIHANDVSVGLLSAIPVAEAVMETAYNNIQYAVDANTVFAVGSFNPTPQNLRNEVSGGGSYERPFTIIDSFEEEAGPSEYKVTFTNINGLDLYDSNGVLTNGVLDYRSKTDIHAELDRGIKVYGLTADRTLNFTITRRTHSGVEKDIYSGTLDYVYLSNPPIYHGSGIEIWTELTSGTELYVSDGGFIRLHIDSSRWTPPTGLDIASSIKQFSLIGGSAQGSYTETSSSVDVDMRYFTYPLSSSVSYNGNATVITEWGAVTIIPNVTIYVGWTSESSVTSYSNSTNNDMSRISQSNYWDGTYMNISQLALGLSDNTLSTTDNRSDRFVVNKVAPPTYQGAVSEDFLREDAADRMLHNGPNGKTYAFYCEHDTNDNRIIKVNVWNSATDTSPASTVDYQVMTNYAGSGDGWLSYENKITYLRHTQPARSHWNVGISQVLYDSSNEDVYLLVMAEEQNESAHAIIVKMNWDVVNGYTFNTIKSIQLTASNEQWNIEAHLTDDFSRLITIQSQYGSYNQFLDRTKATGYNRIRVYDKDTGGANNWGLTTTTVKTTNTLRPLTRKRAAFHDVNYCDINGSDTLITSWGHVFKKDEGGVNNWGESDQLSLTVRSDDHISIVKYSQDFIFATSGFRGYQQNGFWVCDNANFQLFSKYGTNPRVSSEMSAGSGCIEMLEASRNSNVIGFWINTETTRGNHTYKVKLYQT